MTKFRCKWLTLSVAFWSSVGWFHGACASPIDAAAMSNARDTSGEASGQLQEVVVTAQKRSERLQDVPLAVTAVGQDEIAALGAKTLEDLSRTVPGLFLGDTGLGYTTPTIRGVVMGGGSASTVGIYIDDTPIEIDNPPGGVFYGNTNFELYDLDRVEVLRGPQGTLYGGSAMGGTIRYVTPRPSLTGGISGRTTLEFSETQGGGPNFNVGSAIGAPIIDGVLGFRASAYLRSAGGYIDRMSRDTGEIVGDNVNSAQSGLIHTTFLAKPSDELSLELSVLYQGESHHDLNTYARELPRFEQDNVIGQPGNDHLILPSVTINYDFGPMTLTSVSSYFDRSSVQIYDYSRFISNIFTGYATIPGFTDFISHAQYYNGQRNIAQEVRLASNSSGPLNWIAGAYFSRQNHRVLFPLAEPQWPDIITSLFGSPDALGPELPGHVDYLSALHSSQEQMAGFADLSYEVLSGLKITGGVRFSHIKYSYTQVQDGPLNGGYSYGSGEATSNPVSPKGGISYNLAPDTMIYLSAAKGFRSGAPNGPVPLQACAADLAANNGKAPPATYDPDTVWSYEVGFKSISWDHRLRANLSLYHIDWKNIQTPIGLPTCGFQYTANLGDAKLQGAELELSLAPLRQFTIGASASYEHARYVADVYGAPNPSTGMRSAYALAGDPIVGVPTWTGSVNGEYHVPIAGGFEGYLNASYQYQGSFPDAVPPGRVGYLQGYYDNYFPGTAYSYGVLRAGARDDKWNVSAFVNNVANAHPALTTVGIDVPTRDPKNAISSTLRPRVIGITFERQF